MGIRAILGGSFAAMANAIAGAEPRDMNNPMWWADHGGRLAMSGVDVSERRVSQLSAVQSVRFGLTGAMSSLPFLVFRRGEGNSRTALPNHPLSVLLGKRPNWRQSPGEFLGELSWHLSYWKNAYIRLIPGVDYAIGELEIIHPRRRIRIEQHPDGRIYYTFRRLDGGGVMVLRDDEVWHLRGTPLTEDGLAGEPIWETAREVFGRAIAVHDYGDLWFRNSGQGGGFLKHPGSFKDKKDRQDFLDNWREAGTGLNRHRDRLLTHGVDYKSEKITNAEAQLLETEKAADTAIFGLWSYPPHRASRLDKASFTNIEHQGQDFVTYVLSQLAIAIEQGAERDLLLDNDAGDLFAEFNFAGLLRGDLLTRYRAYLIGRQGEWLSANDILRLENMNPRTDAGGSEYKNPLTKDSADGQGTRSGNEPNGNGGGSGGDRPNDQPDD